jgi:hypothetical protein
MLNGYSDDEADDSNSDDEMDDDAHDSMDDTDIDAHDSHDDTVTKVLSAAESRSATAPPAQPLHSLQTLDLMRTALTADVVSLGSGNAFGKPVQCPGCKVSELSQARGRHALRHALYVPSLSQSGRFAV